MSGRIDSVGGSASSVSLIGAFGPETVANDQYRKINRKEKIKLIKLNSDNYQNWTNDMKILLSVKIMWFLVFGTTLMFDSLKFFDRMKWLIDNVQTKTWIYVNLKNSQHNHIKKLIIAHAMWEALKKMHDAFDQGRLNFLKKKFFNYKAEATESIDDVCSNLSRLQMTIRDIRSTKASTDLNIALTLINSIDNEAYIMTKYHLKDMKNLTLTHTQKRLKLMKQKIKNDSTTDDVANKGTSNEERPKKQDNKRECYFCNKRGHYKLKCFKWLTTDEGKKYAEKQTKKKNQFDASEKKPTNQKKKNQTANDLINRLKMLELHRKKKKMIQMKSEWSLINMLIRSKNGSLIRMPQGIWLQMSQFLSSNKRSTAQSRWSTIRPWRFKKSIKLNLI